MVSKSSYGIACRVAQDKEQGKGFFNRMTEITEQSLAIFVKENATVAEVDEAIASVDGVQVGEWETPGDDFGERMFADSIKTDVAVLKFLAIDSFSDLEAELRERQTAIVVFFDKYTEPLLAKRGRPRGGVTRGVSVSYLANLLAGQTRNHQTVKKFLNIKGLFDFDSVGEFEGFSVDNEARRIIDCYEQTAVS